jgi:acetylornithine deacetylase/succinyl-diaminopimelate desuccinylase-like protein
MNSNDLEKAIHEQISNDSSLVNWHLDYLEKMVKVDSRSFNVNEFEGDRKTPTDMKEILELAREYLKEIGFSNIVINKPPPGPDRSTPIMMAELLAGKEKPTILMYAHLDKQPYMDDEKFLKWDGVSPTELKWNEDRSRAYGRGAADDLSGVVAIGLAAHFMLKHVGYNKDDSQNDVLAEMPCNLKIIFETEEESGSHTLIEQIEQNKDFFSDSDCVIITDVVNPAQGVPGLTTSLRGIAQVDVTMVDKNGVQKIDAQTALYKTLAKLCKDDRSIAIEGIANADIPITDEEHQKLAIVPTTLQELREGAGVLEEIKLTVPDDKAEIIKAQLRKSYANVRPGHRVAGGVIFGSAGAKLTFNTGKNIDRVKLRNLLLDTFSNWNTFNLKLELTELKNQSDSQVSFNLILQSSVKDPHSGVHGGPFPVAEIEIARMIDQLITGDGTTSNVSINEMLAEEKNDSHKISVSALHVENDDSSKAFLESSAKAQVEVRLAPGNDESKVDQIISEHLIKNTPVGFEVEITGDKVGSPWITGIEHPAFPLVLSALESGYKEKACIYGCGGSIPFVAKLMQALGGIPPLCLGPYDPACKMHEPGESLSMPDLLGCARSIVFFMAASSKAFKNN